MLQLVTFWTQRNITMSHTVPQFLNLVEVAELARSRMTKMAYDYFASGAETETSVSDNRSSFADYRIVPRILVDVSKVDTSFSWAGSKWSMPVMVAPMAMHGLAHADKEVRTVAL